MMHFFRLLVLVLTLTFPDVYAFIHFRFDHFDLNQNRSLLSSCRLRMMERCFLQLTLLV